MQEVIKYVSRISNFVGNGHLHLHLRLHLRLQLQLCLWSHENLMNCQRQCRRRRYLSADHLLPLGQLPVATCHLICPPLDQIEPCPVLHSRSVSVTLCYCCCCLPHSLQSLNPFWHRPTQLPVRRHKATVLRLQLQRRLWLGGNYVPDDSAKSGRARRSL